MQDVDSEIAVHLKRLGRKDPTTKSHKEAKQFRFKSIPNWDDIVDLCAKDRATGLGAETAMDANEVISTGINKVDFVDLEDTSASVDLEEPGSSSKRKGLSSSSTSNKSQRRKIGEKDGIVVSLHKVAETFDRLVQVFEEKVDENEIGEVLDEVALILNLDRQEWAKVIKWLADFPKQLAIVKTLPIEDKKDYVLTHVSLV